MLRTVTETSPASTSSASSDWQVVGGQAKASPQAASSAPLLPINRAQPLSNANSERSPGMETISSPPLSSPVSSTANDGEIMHHFEMMRLPQHGSWAQKVIRAGYQDMLLLQEADLEVLAAEIGMPSGVKQLLKRGLTAYRNGEFESVFALPVVDLNATAPTQAGSGWDWKTIALVAGGVVVVGVGIGFAFASAPAAGAAAAAGAEISAGEAAAILGLSPAVVAGLQAGTLVAVSADCLDGDAEITDVHGKQKKIRDIKQGDKVLSYNKGKTLVKNVLEVKTGRSRNMYEVLFAGPTGQFKIRATGGHPFYSKTHQGWVVPDPSANKSDKLPQKLEVGCQLVLRSGAVATVRSISKLQGSIPTYNLIVDGPGTFFVQQLLSHSGLPPKTA